MFGFTCGWKKVYPQEEIAQTGENWPSLQAGHLLNARVKTCPHAARDKESKALSGALLQFNTSLHQHSF